LTIKGLKEGETGLNKSGFVFVSRFMAVTRTAQGFQGVEVKSKNAASGKH